jgi:hypothetical protein
MVESLRHMYEEASSMDESSLFPLPVGLFEHIDDLERNNPEIYQFKLIEDCNNRTENVLRRVTALEVSNFASLRTYMMFVTKKKHHQYKLYA